MAGKLALDSRDGVTGMERRPRASDPARCARDPSGRRDPGPRGPNVEITAQHLADQASRWLSPNSVPVIRRDRGLVLRSPFYEGGGGGGGETLGEVVEGLRIPRRFPERLRWQYRG